MKTLWICLGITLISCSGKKEPLRIEKLSVTEAPLASTLSKASGSNISVSEEGSCEVLARNGSYQFTAPSQQLCVY